MSLTLEAVMNQPIGAMGETALAFKCTPATTVREALDTLQGAKIGCLIVSEGNTVLGIFTERDILMKITGKDLNLANESVSSYMTKDPVTVSRSNTVGDAMRLMVTYNFRHLVVAESKSSMVQIISIKDLCQFVVNAMDKGI